MWFDALHLVEFAMNITINISTGFAPFEMLYSTQVVLPIDHAFLAPLTSVATSHVENIKKIVQKARATMAKAQQD